MDKRLNEVETRLAFMDDALAQLTGAETENSRRLIAIERTLAELRVELAAIRSGLAEDVHQEPPPPHY